MQERLIGCWMMICYQSFMNWNGELEQAPEGRNKMKKKVGQLTTEALKYVIGLKGYWSVEQNKHWET